MGYWDYCWGIYGDYFETPFPHSLLGTRQCNTHSEQKRREISGTMPSTASWSLKAMITHDSCGHQVKVPKRSCKLRRAFPGVKNVPYKTNLAMCRADGLCSFDGDMDEDGDTYDADADRDRGGDVHGGCGRG